MLLWVEEHGSTDAVFAIGTMEDIYIDTTLTTAPERFVISKIGEGDRKISQLGVHFITAEPDVKEKILHEAIAVGQA